VLNTDAMSAARLGRLLDRGGVEWGGVEGREGENLPGPPVRRVPFA